MQLEDHPTVKWFRQQAASPESEEPKGKLQTQWLRQLCLESGADDAGFVEMERPGLADQREDLREVMPRAKTVVSAVFKLNGYSLQTVAHSVANLEFRQAWAHANHVGREIVSRLVTHGVRALNAPAGFPYEADRWPGKMWFTCDKLVAVEAGLGHMGWNRLVIHPTFGDCVVLGTILIDAEVDSYGSPLDYKPCIECKLCVSVCPVGAVRTDGTFDFPSCYTHNYRERLGGFQNWVDNLVASGSVREYRKKISDAETISMWQNLSIGPQTRCDRCMAVCPAGKEVIGDFLTDRKAYTQDIMKRLHEKDETVYVVAGSDAEAHVTAKFPEKKVKRVSNGIRPNSTQGFLESLPLVFQRNQSEGLNATYHFTFTGAEPCRGTAIIRDKTIEVLDGHVGRPDLHLTADSDAWIAFLAKEKHLLWALLTRQIRIKGPMKLMPAFAKCFPA
jgi:epoxyqueuosine reductase QueG/putative sterol carrier protein